MVPKRNAAAVARTAGWMCVARSAAEQAVHVHPSVAVVQRVIARRQSVSWIIRGNRLHAKTGGGACRLTSQRDVWVRQST